MAYLRNTWYVAAWDDELQPGQLLARRLLDEPVLLYREEDGTPRALFDRCPHRFLPLSKGRLCGNELQCAYHGLRFDGSGACTHNPHGEGAIPPGAKVRAYPVAERHSAIWIWMGDPLRADAAAIADFGRSLDPATRFVAKDYLLARAHYQLEIDNILDLSHLEFLHASTLGSGAVKHAQTEVVQDGHTVYSLRLTRNETVTDALAATYGIPQGQGVDRWLDVRYDVPAQMELWSGFAPAGAPDPRQIGKRIPFVHLFTPETATTTHYWFATSYPRKMGEEGRRRAEHDIAFLRQPFEHEDLPVLEAQQQSIGTADFWSLRPVLLAGDAAVERARRVLDGLIRAENAAAALPAPRAAAGDAAMLQLRVVDKRLECTDVCSFELVTANGRPLPPFDAGAHIVLHLPGGRRRPYSLCGDPADRQRYLIGVLRTADSRGGSRLLHDEVRIGQTIEATGPRNRFALVRDAAAHRLLAGGIGITPLLAMAQVLWREEAAFELHYFVRSPAHVAFAERLRQAHFADRLQIHIDPPGRSAPDLAAALARPPDGGHLYLCGPAAFMDAAKAEAATAGWRTDSVHQERFVAEAQAAASAGGTGFEVELARTGGGVCVGAGETLVQALARCGVEVPTSCGQGVCGTCRVGVLDGVPDHRDSYLTPEERARGDCLLACSSRARSARLLLDL